LNPHIDNPIAPSKNFDTLMAEAKTYPFTVRPTWIEALGCRFVDGTVYVGAGEVSIDFPWILRSF